ncbi:MAG TPA: alpha/beta hydrolase, partial [Polyangiales bacterium]|nr:alpha/beta hydrolase [Polyangiales bacterium]
TGGTGGMAASDAGAPSDLVDCVTTYDTTLAMDSSKKCKSYTTLPPQSTKIDLGPYGATSQYNVGKDFAITPSSSDTDNGATCSVVGGTFMEDPMQTAKLLKTDDLDFGLYSIFYPADWPAGQKLPIIVWGNGTCAAPEGYGALLRYVASYGYFIVAPNSRWVGQSDPKSGKTPMFRALDYAFAETANTASEFYQKLDTTKVGAMGHSQGGSATVTEATDSRVQSVIIWNAANGATKPWFSVSGDMDVFSTTPAAMQTASKASMPSAWMYFHNPVGQGPIRGHLVLMITPQRVVQQTVAWWDMMLKGSADAKATFTGSTCKWCGHDSDYEFGANL